MIESLYEKFISSTGVSTDTRTMKKGNLFFALNGPHYDANKFAGEAIDKGAFWAVIDDPKYKKDPRFIHVGHSLTALQELAVFHRKQLNIPFLAITGSNGKTTTKELCKAVLSTTFRVTATQGNLNNHIGVPITVLSVTQDTNIAIIEMGANKRGEISELCVIANPTLGIITNLGKAHIEGFGSFEGVVAAKTELYDHLVKNNGGAFINSRNPVLSPMSYRFKHPIFYPGPGDYYHCEFIKADPYISFRSEGGEEIDTRLIGSYNFENIAVALCVGKYFGIDENMVNNAIAEYVPSNMRSQVIMKGNNMVIMDAYNANPASMEAALTTLMQMPAQRKVAILGDMFELGAISEEEHRNIGKHTAVEGIDEVIFCGPMMKHARTMNPSARYFENKNSLEEFLSKHHFTESVILIKASRGMQFETIVNLI